MSLANVDQTPSHAMMLYVDNKWGISLMSRTGGSKEVVRSEDWPSPRFQASTKGDRYHILTCSAYVNAAYCGANPVSHPNPPNPPCATLDPHCWASTLGKGRHGIGATAWGGL